MMIRQNLFEIKNVVCLREEIKIIFANKQNKNKIDTENNIKTKEL